jgi:hypothetical protein
MRRAVQSIPAAGRAASQAGLSGEAYFHSLNAWLRREFVKKIHKYEAHLRSV